MMYLSTQQTAYLLLWTLVAVSLTYTNTHLNGTLSNLKLISKFKSIKVSLLIKVVILKSFISFQNVQLTISGRTLYIFAVVRDHYRKLKRVVHLEKESYSLFYMINKNLHKGIKFSINKLQGFKIRKLVFLTKPISSGSLKVNYISKMLIRRSRFFNKTKYSFIRQECKNIVHLTLLLNIFFVFAMLNVYMHWTFSPSYPVIILSVFILYSTPILLKTKKLLSFYLNVLDR